MLFLSLSFSLESDGHHHVSWADRCESPPQSNSPPSAEEIVPPLLLADTPRSPGRAITLHQRLSSPSRKRYACCVPISFLTLLSECVYIHADQLKSQRGCWNRNKYAAFLHHLLFTSLLCVVGEGTTGPQSPG